MLSVTVVIPVYNYPNIRKCLASITMQDYPNYEVLVVDDGSTDETPAVVAEFPSVRYVRKAQGGAASARNTGAELSAADIVFFLDSDCVVDEDCIRQMIAPLEAEPTIGMTHAIYGIENVESFVARLIYEKCDYVFRDLDEMDFAWSFGIAMRRQVFLDIGMFDHEFPGAGSEDIDFAYRLCDAGFRIKLVREAVVRHHFHDTLYKHLRRHRAQAKLRMMLIDKQTKYFDQQARPEQYLNLLTHGAFIASLPLTEWTTIPSGILLSAALSFHLPLAWWTVRKTGKPEYWAFLGFEFLTLMAWVVGCIEGSWWVMGKKIKG